MNIILKNVGKRFGRDWIFRHIDLEIGTGCTLISGGNGSGKSTLLSLMSGFGISTEGSISYITDDVEVPRETIYKQVTISAPYLELYDDFTLEETIRFHQRLKPLDEDFDTASMISTLHLESHRKKQVKYFSSGMKQRVKLGLAICSKSSLVLLDEPGSNLDSSGLEWYLSLVQKLSYKKSIVVFSVSKSDENSFCTSHFRMESFKPQPKQ
jgi:ABC-type multidrug transport system ATPase subunit